MNTYKDSTQFKNWKFTQQELDKLQLTKFERGLKILAELNRDLQQMHLKTGGQNNKGMREPENKAQTKVSVNLKKIIQPYEEKEYIIYYTNQIKDIINRKTPSRSLKTYSLTFFRRFYLRKTAIDYDPDYLLCAALFLGFKVSQLSVNLDIMKNICPFLKEKHTDKNVENILLLLEYEFFLINILNYDIYVFCPYKAMIGFIHEIRSNQRAYNMNVLNNENVKEFEKECEALIDQTFCTDLIFIISYSYIALGCIFLTAELFNIHMDNIKLLLDLDSVINYSNFLESILPLVKSSLNSIKILKEEEFVNYKKKIMKFVIKNPKYVEKIEKDREGVKTKMKQFSDNFDDNLVNSQIKTEKIKNDYINKQKKEEGELLEHKRDRAIQE